MPLVGPCSVSNRHSTAPRLKSQMSLLSHQRLTKCIHFPSTFHQLNEGSTAYVGHSLLSLLFSHTKHRNAPMLRLSTHATTVRSEMRDVRSEIKDVCIILAFTLCKYRSNTSTVVLCTMHYKVQYPRLSNPFLPSLVY